MESIYYVFVKEGIIIDYYGLSRFGDRLVKIGFLFEEVIEFVKNNKFNYIDFCNGCFVIFDEVLKVVVI